MTRNVIPERKDEVGCLGWSYVVRNLGVVGVGPICAHAHLFPPSTRSGTLVSGEAGIDEPGVVPTPGRCARERSRALEAQRAGMRASSGEVRHGGDRHRHGGPPAAATCGIRRDRRRERHGHFRTRATTVVETGGETRYLTATRRRGEQETKESA
jgi:hypothetical protein